MDNPRNICEELFADPKTKEAVLVLIKVMVAAQRRLDTEQRMEKSLKKGGAISLLSDPVGLRCANGVKVIEGIRGTSPWNISQEGEVKS